MWAQIKALQAWIAVALSIALFASGLFLGAKWSSANGANRAVTLMADQLAEAKAERVEDRKKIDRLQKTLDKLPKLERKHADVVRANPAGCDRSAPVADSLQDGIDKANASRALPSDS
ncbi:MAG TPA: hypothetical protein VIT62_08915 [Lysobacter sp.]